MTENNQTNQARTKALRLIEKSERNFKLGLYGALLLEFVFLAMFVLAADLIQNQLHLLLLISTITTYSIVSLGLFALGAHVSRNTQLVLKAIELLDQNGSAPVRK